MQKVSVLTVDKPNKNNRTYPRELICKELDRIQEDVKRSRCFVYRSPACNSLSDIVGVVFSVDLINDDVVIEVKMLDNCVPVDPLCIKTTGTGRVDDSGVVSDYTLIGFSLEAPSYN